MNVSVGAKSDVGRVRKANEDAMLVDAPLFVVADGMGGHLAGDVASATAIETIKRSAKDQPPKEPSHLESYVRAANRAIWDKALEDSQLQGMGTTCTLLFLDGDTAHLAHVGDSRAYLLRDGDVTQLTEDHTLVERMVREGKLQRDQASRHPQRSIITRALGVEADVEVDLLAFDVAQGDRLLLCSDGLSSMIEDGAIREILADAADAEDAANRLIDAALDAGGEDNVTVVVLDFLADGALAPAPAAARREDTTPRRSLSDEEPHPEASSSRSGLRKLLAMLLLLGVLLAAAFFAARYALENSWFVGANDSGEVVIFTGIPDEIAGLSFREEQASSGLMLDELPAFLSSNVEEGIKVATREEAENTIANLEERARDFGGRDRSSGGGDGAGAKN